MTAVIERENKIIRSELDNLKSEVEQACAVKASFKAREQLIRFENVLRFYSSIYDLGNSYQKAIFEMKLRIFRHKELENVQNDMLEEIRSLALDVKYLSKM